MSEEEIAQEREESGWNPYRTEEIEADADQMFLPPEENFLPQKREEEPVQPFRKPASADHMQEEGQPWFQGFCYPQLLENQREAERDFMRLQSMYPYSAKQLLPLVEEVCDQLEYEGSIMFDEYPDPTGIWRMQQQIVSQAQDLHLDETQEGAQLLAAQAPCPGCQGPGAGLFGDLVRVLLLHEMHHRRRRYHDCRPGRW